MIKVYSISLGCPKNRVDSERTLGELGRLLGSPLRPVKRLASADLVFINTCGFIAPAVQESVRTILENAQVIGGLRCETKPLLAVSGCLVGRYGEENLKADLPEVDLWLETSRLGEWPRQLHDALTARNPAAALPRVRGRNRLEPPGRFLSTRSYAWLKISEGCGQSCAFCTIPMIRGTVRSDSAESLVQEAQELLDRGVSEIILVAQDLTSWGRDLPGQPGLRQLIEKMLPLNGLRWLRLMYLYPAGLDGELLEFLAEAHDGGKSPLLPYFDVPLQHADEAVLKRMGRPFALQNPFRVVERIRKYFPQAALRTSLITGFPGETEAQFETLCRFVSEARFQNLGVFSFYAEDGTPAAAMADQLPDRVKDFRRDSIMELQADISEEMLKTYVGEHLDIIIDEPHAEWPGLFMGRAWFQAPEVDGVVYVSAENVKPGDMVRAEVTESYDYDLNALADE